MITLKILAAWLFADFLSGLVHWWEDRHLHEGTWLKQIYDDNVKHHVDPASITRISWAENIRGTLLIAVPIALSLFLMDVLMVIWVGVLFSGFGNLVHRFSHEKRSRVPLVVRWIQATGLFASPKHHNEHHRKAGVLVEKDIADWRFCAMTNYLNPILDGTGFWKFMDKLFNVFCAPRAR